MQLSPHFTLAEMERSQTALRKGIANDANVVVIGQLTRLCTLILEPARDLLGVPITISSGYRSPQLNRSVGGAPDSAHLSGRAADIIPVGMPLAQAFDILRRSALPYDQVITECNAWIHIAIAREGATPRRQMLAATGGPGHWKYEAIAA